MGATPPDRDGDEQRRAVDDRREDEARALAVVGDVDRYARRTGRGGGGFVDRAIVGRHEDDAHAGDVLGPERTLQPAQFAAPGGLHDRGRGARGNDGDVGACGLEQRELPRGDAAAADEERRGPLQVEEDREVPHA